MVRVASSGRRQRTVRAPCSLTRMLVFVGCSLVAFMAIQIFWMDNIHALSSPRPGSPSMPMNTDHHHTGNDSSSVANTGKATTVAFAVSVTGCGADPITEGGAVLQHSIHRASIHGQGKYDYKLFAIYHPSASKCALPLAALGYELLERDVFVNVAMDIEGEYLRNKIGSNGCCGEKELIKLEAYKLTDYPIVVHLDLDVLILKPLDDLFDMMLLGPQSVDNTNDFVMQEHDHQPEPLPERINAFFTLDYNMVKPGAKFKPVQGGFLVTRPDLAVYEEFRSIVKKGDFRNGSGWGGKVGPFYGSMTFQGA